MSKVVVVPRSIPFTVMRGNRVVDEVNFDKDFTDISHRKFAGTVSHPKWGKYEARVKPVCDCGINTLESGIGYSDYALYRVVCDCGTCGISYGKKIEESE